VPTEKPLRVQVAEAMGLSVRDESRYGCTCSMVGMPSDGGAFPSPRSAREPHDHIEWKYWHVYEYEDDGDWREVPAYDVDPTAAWRVMQHVRERAKVWGTGHDAVAHRFGVALVNRIEAREAKPTGYGFGASQNWRASDAFGAFMIHATPEDICLAALKALEPLSAAGEGVLRARLRVRLVAADGLSTEMVVDKPRPDIFMVLRSRPSIARADGPPAGYGPEQRRYTYCGPAEDGVVEYHEVYSPQRTRVVAEAGRLPK
jgi:hypothetical protein